MKNTEKKLRQIVAVLLALVMMVSSSGELFSGITRAAAETGTT